MEVAERMTVAQLRADLRKWEVAPGQLLKRELVARWAQEAQRRGLVPPAAPHGGTLRSASPRGRRPASRSPRGKRTASRSPYRRLSMPPLEPLSPSPPPAPRHLEEEGGQKRARTEDEAVALVVEKHSSGLAAGLAASVAGLAGLALFGGRGGVPPDELLGFVAALGERAAAFQCGEAPTAFLPIPPSLRNRTLPAHVQLLENGALAQATQFSLPLLCRTRLAFIGALPYLAVATATAFGLWLLVRRRQIDAETHLFAQQLAAFVEEHLVVAEGQPVFVDLIKQRALAPQAHLSQARREQVWQVTQRLVESNPRIMVATGNLQGEQCTTWRIVDA